jgi:hypothetical protein
VIITKMESVNNYKFYSFQQMPPTPKYDLAMKEMALLFQNAIKEELGKPYPFAPGYNGSRKSNGIRNLKKKTGALYNSVKVTFDPKTDQLKVNMLEYWKNVNDGRKPGKYVPLKPLMDWIKIKGFNRDTRGRFKKFNIKGTAFAISTNIKKFGIQPTNFYDNAFDKFIDAFDDPNGPMKNLGMDLTEFFKKIIETE